MSEPVAELRVRVRRGKGGVVVVKVWRTLADLRARYRAWGGRGGRRIYGFCQIYDHYKESGRKARDFAEIGLCARHLTQTIVAHEAGHAAIGWMEKAGIRGAELEADDRGQATDGEESVCYVLGDIVGGITAGLRGLGYELG